MALAETAWAGFARRGPSIVRRFRLGSGLVLFSYRFLHFLNHSMGNISLAAMERGAEVAELIWRSRVGTVALYGAFAIHFSLAFWALYIRRHLRMGWIEGLRLALGFSIPLLVLQHALAQRFAYTYFDIHPIYRNVLYLYWVADPKIAGVRQITLFSIAWLHGCIGLYLWLRVKRHFRRYAPFLLIVAVLLPTTALLGVFQGARHVAEMAQTDPAWRANLRKTGVGANPAAQAALWTIALWSWGGFAGALALVLAARGVRVLAERRGGTIRIIYPDGRAVRIPRGSASSTPAGAPGSPMPRCAAAGRVARPAGSECCWDRSTCRGRHR